MVCEMVFTSALGALIAPTLGSLSACSRRNWVVMSVVGVYAVLVVWLRPMRSHVGNAVFVASVLCLFAAALLMATGLELSSSRLYSDANILLLAAGVFGVVRYLVALLAVCVEACRHDHQSRGRQHGCELKARQGDELATALHRLHSTAANLSPLEPEVTRYSAEEESGEGDTEGMGKRLCEGLNVSSAVDWTVSELRSGLVPDWGMVAGAATGCTAAMGVKGELLC
eukprot:Hpha_TRINITY_DN16564_c0_g1::TRINITY_DN16564_c0_g1_i7::g.135413::m.135413